MDSHRLAFLCSLCLVFVFVFSRADLLALLCVIFLMLCLFANGVLGQVLYLILSIPDLCFLPHLQCI